MKASRSDMYMVTTTPYGHEQNGRVERYNRSLAEMVRVAMLHGAIPIKYWCYIVPYCAWLYARLPSVAFDGKSRYEIAYGRAPDLRAAKVIGCLVHVLKPVRYRTHKFDCKAWRCVNLGWNPYSAGWNVLICDENRVTCTCEVVFHETVFPLRAPLKPSISVNGGVSDKYELFPDIISSADFAKLPVICLLRRKCLLQLLLLLQMIRC